MRSSQDSMHKIENVLILYVIDTGLELICYGLLYLARNLYAPYPKGVKIALISRTISSIAILINLLLAGPQMSNTFLGYINFLFVLPIVAEPVITSVRDSQIGVIRGDGGYYANMLKSSNSYFRFVVMICVIMVCLKRMIMDNISHYMAMQPILFVSTFFFLFALVSIITFTFNVLFSI
jgi:hypothetical protein